MSGRLDRNGIPIIMDLAVMQSALHNTVPGTVDPNLPSTVAYGRGLLVGLVAALQAVGWPADEALACALGWLPRNHNPECVPPTWRERHEELKQHRPR